MNYIYYLKQQLKLFMLCAPNAIIMYVLACHFKWREPTTWPLQSIIIFVLTYIFFGALFNKWFYSLKK